MLLHERPFIFIFLVKNTLLHGNSKHDYVQAFFLLPLLTFILSYLPKIYDWQSSGLLLDPLGAHSSISRGGGGSFISFSLLERNYCPGGTVGLWKCKIREKLWVKWSPPWHSSHHVVHVDSDGSESSFGTWHWSDARGVAILLPMPVCLAAPLTLPKPHPASAPGPLGADAVARWPRVACKRARSRFIPPHTALPFHIFPLYVLGSPSRSVSPKHGLRTDHANHIFYCILIHRVTEDVLWLLILSSCVTCFYSNLQHQQLVGFPCWYLLKVEAY